MYICIGQLFFFGIKVKVEIFWDLVNKRVL